MADRVADQTHEISMLIVSREHIRLSKEGWRDETLHLQEEVNKLKAEKGMQKGLTDMYYEKFEEVTSLLQNQDAEYHTLVVKYEERRQRVMNWIDDHLPLTS